MWPFDQNNQQMYQQYSQAYDTRNYNTIDQNQAMGHMQQFIQNAPPQMQQQVYQQHFEQMPYEQRAWYAQQMAPQYNINPNNPYEMAQGFQQLGQQQPNMLLQLFGQEGSYGNQMGHGGLGGLVGLAARALMNHQQSNFGGGQPYGYGENQYGYRAEEREERREENAEYRREEREERRERNEGYEERRERAEEREERRERRDEY